jgi:hypothetical protein
MRLAYRCLPIGPLGRNQFGGLALFGLFKVCIAEFISGVLAATL